MESLNEFLRKGLETVGSVVDTANAVTRSMDGSIVSIDQALRGSTPPSSPEQAWENIMAHLRSAKELARGGYAGSPAVAQKAREILSIVNQVPKSKPSDIKTRNDMLCLSIRDLRGSQALMQLASGRGTIEDIDRLIGWMSDISGRVQRYPQASQPIVQEAGIPGMGKPKVSTEATIAHQNKEIRKHALLLEGHLQQKCKIGGIACDCCEKHPIIILGLAEEAIGMVDNPIYYQIMAWCQKVEPITTEAASASGQYDDLYPQLAIELRDLRKSLASQYNTIA